MSDHLEITSLGIKTMRGRSLELGWRGGVRESGGEAIIVLFSNQLSWIGDLGFKRRERGILAIT